MISNYPGQSLSAACTLRYLSVSPASFAGCGFLIWSDVAGKNNFYAFVFYKISTSSGTTNNIVQPVFVVAACLKPGGVYK
jgi:hypothetical protein